MFTIDVLRTSQKRHPLDVTLEHLQEVFRAFLQKPKNYKTATSLVSQAHIWWNKLKIMQWKCFCTRGSKLTSQGRHTTDFCSGRFEDVHRTLLQNFKNKQQLGFKYFSHTHLPMWIENNTTVMCFLLSLRLGDVPRTSLCRRHFRTH